MVATAVGKLRRGNVDNAFACTFGYLVHKAYQILVRVAETHATTNAAFEKRCRTRKTECYHTLILIPYIHHAVELFFVCCHTKCTQQIVPISAQFGQSSFHFFSSIETCNTSFCLCFVDNIFAFPFIFLLVLHISKHKNQVLAFARRKCHFHIMRGNGRPTMRFGVAWRTFEHRLRFVKTIVQTKKCFAVGVKTFQGCIYRVIGIMVAALFVFGFMINYRIFNFHLSG